jgi:hypothetical protein
MSLMKHLRFTCLLSCAVISCCKAFPQDNPTAESIVEEMILTTKTIGSLSYSLGRHERFEGEVLTEYSAIKLERDPFKVYLEITRSYKSMREGVEVLYVAGERDNEALINPPFLFWNLTKDPFGNTLREDQHHTILDLGFDHIVSIMEYQMEKYALALDGMLQVLGPAKWDEQECWRIEFNNPNFEWASHTVTEGEDLLTIAREYKLSEHMIMEKNNLRGYDDVSPGDILQLPVDYAAKMVILVDKERKVPRYMEVYDDEGLYEQYEFNDLVIDPQFKAEEFNSNYKDYGF